MKRQKKVEEIQKWIDAKMPELMDDFFAILRIRSVAEPKTLNPIFGEGCAKVLDKMLSIGEGYGFSTHNFDGYVGKITWKGTQENSENSEGVDGSEGSENQENPEKQKKREEIGIWAHLDVVDDCDGRGYTWEYPPYEPTMIEGGVVARGSQDNKSSAIMALYVLRYLQEHKIQTKRDISLYCGTCEEQGMFDLDYFTAHYPCPDLSLVPDAGFPICQGERGSFNGELTSLEDIDEEILSLEADSGLYMIPEKAVIKLSYSEEKAQRLGALPDRITVELAENTITITYTGVSSHAANPYGGVDALKGLVEFLFERKLLSENAAALLGLVKELNKDYHAQALELNCSDELSGPIILAVTQAKIVDRKLVLSFISKYPVSQTGETFEKTASEAAEKRGYRLKVTRYSKPISYPSAHPALSLLTEVYSDISGEAARPYIMSGGTYARKLPNAFAYGAGIPEQWPPKGIFLPGHGDFHQPDESVSIKRIKTALLVYICSICELDELDCLG